jgi:hypothetical protein
MLYLSMRLLTPGRPRPPQIRSEARTETMPLSRSDQARVNGAKSRGPKTSEGKTRSSLNALKHGRYAINAIVLSNEDAEALEELVAHYVCRIQPTDPVEYSLTRELASIDWRLTRVFALDTRMLDREMDIQLPALVTAGHSLSELTRLLDASRSIADRSKLPAYLARRETQLLNARRSILAVLKDLRKNFPSSDPAPEVVLPQPLDPESPLQNEPGTNPTCDSRPKRVSAVSEEALQRRAGSPEPVSNGNAAFGADSENAPELCAPPPRLISRADRRPQRHSRRIPPAQLPGSMPGSGTNHFRFDFNYGRSQLAIERSPIHRWLGKHPAEPRTGPSLLCTRESRSL